MNEVIKVEELEDGGWLEHYSSGKVQAKNAEGKMIKHTRNEMPSKTASEMAKAGAQKQLDNIDTAESLLDELGLSGEFHLQLAKVLIKGGSGAVGAAKELVKASKERGVFKDDRAGLQNKPAPGSICPTCDELVMVDFRPSPEQLDAVAEFIERDNEGLIQVDRLDDLITRLVEGDTDAIDELKEARDNLHEFNKRDTERRRNWLPKTGKQEQPPETGAPIDYADTGADPIEEKPNGK